MEKSYVMIKPGFLQYEEQIEKRIEGIGAKVTHKKVMKLNDEILNRHYAEHIGKGFFNELVDYMKSGNKYSIIHRLSYDCETITNEIIERVKQRM